jgi:flagellar biosynthesis/type III secretory pathway protein FliH
LNCAAELEGSEIRRLLPQPIYSRATEVVEMIARTPTERQQYESRRRAERDLTMFVDDALERGRDEGRELGREEGRELGEQLGRKNALIEQIQNLQKLLLEPLTSAEALRSLDIAALSQRIEQLLARLTPKS